MSNNQVSVDPNVVNQSYKPFPSFKQWAQHSIDTNRWQIHIESKRNSGTTDQDVLRRARKIVSRTAAIETGVIGDRPRLISPI